jgi:ribonuclease R
MKDKGAAASGGVPTKAATKRAGRNKSEARATEGAHAPRAAQTTMQALKSAVKKAANKMKGRKPRR